MTEERDDPERGASVPLDAVPEPALRYEIRDGATVVTHANSAFDSTFDHPQSETTVADCLQNDSVGLDDGTVQTVSSSLADRETVDVTGSTADDRTVRVRSVPGSTPSEDAGVLTVTATETDDAPVEVENIASVVSHDLRNPLDVATAHLRAAQERGDEEHFERVDDAHDRMERIIQDVLTLARSDGSIDPSEPTDLESVARDAWTTVDTDDATLEIRDDLPTVDADPPRLRRLFENLIRNSMEHGSTSSRPEPAAESATESATQDGSEPAPVTVSVGTTDDGGFFVADDGVGIPEADRERVFEPGYSSSDTGAGLGLTIVERIADGHGWRVTVPAESDGGARFEFHPCDGEE